MRVGIKDGLAQCRSGRNVPTGLAGPGHFHTQNNQIHASFYYNNII